MIRSYTINELEELTAINRRTISDYINKGLLTGPSHRGRGAVYSQRDLNVLQVIPQLRTLMKQEYGSLKSIAAFLSQLSVHDIHVLSSLETERSFIAEVRRLRVRLSLLDLMPYLAPEKIDEVLEALSPEQVCSVDTGRVQLGTILDMSELLGGSPANQSRMNSTSGSNGTGSRAAQQRKANGNGHANTEDDDTDRLPQLDAEAVADMAADEGQATGETRRLLALKLDEIASRLDRVEQMLEYEGE